jgi:hypothetical protein
LSSLSRGSSPGSYFPKVIMSAMSKSPNQDES